MALKTQTAIRITAVACCTIPSVNITLGTNDTAEVIAKEVDAVTKKKTTFTMVVRTVTQKDGYKITVRKVVDFTLGDVWDWLTSKGESANLPSKNNTEIDIRDGDLQLTKVGEQTPNPPGVVTP